MKIKRILCGFLGLLSVSFISGCSSSNAVNTDSSEKNNNDSGNSEINVIKNDNLSIDQNKCVGCGKCARIASANFEMNNTMHKAQIKTAEISNQVAVNNATKACPVGAIGQ